MHQGQLVWASDAEEMIFGLTGNSASCSGRLFAPNVRTKSRILTAATGFTRQRHRKSGMPHPSQLQTDMRCWGDAITQNKFTN